jgi:hypothetical protein
MVCATNPAVMIGKSWAGRPSVATIDGVDPRSTNGPGKVTQALGIDRRQHGPVVGEADCPSNRLPPASPLSRRKRGTRVGSLCRAGVGRKSSDGDGWRGFQRRRSDGFKPPA